MALPKEEKTKIIESYRKKADDTGSTNVQIAILTQQINTLTDHCQTHPKDFSSRQGLLKIVGRRRRFLSYLQEKNESEYKDLIKRLGLRK